MTITTDFVRLNAVLTKTVPSYAATQAATSTASLNSLFQDLYGNSTAANTQAAIQIAANLGLTGELADIAQVYIATQLNAAPYADRGDVLAILASYLAETPAGNAYKATADAFNTAVASAETQASTVGFVGGALSITPVTPPNVGRTFNLTSSTTLPDVVPLTAGNDVINAPNGTLQTNDRLIDGSTSDSDVLNHTMNSYTAGTVQPLMNNIETINAFGSFTTTGFDLTNVTGTRELVLSTGMSNGTAQVDAAMATRAATVTAGQNVTTLTVNVAAAGSSGQLTVDSGNATTINITGGAGADTISYVAKAGQTLTLAGGAGIDSLNLGLTGGTVTTTITNAALAVGDFETITINVAAPTTLDLQSADQLAATGAGNAVTVNGDSVLLIRGDGDALAGAARTNGVRLIDSTGANGSVVLQSNAALAAASFFNRAELDQINFTTVAVGNNVTVNERTTVSLRDVDHGTVTFDVDNAGTTATAAGAGTLTLDLQAATTTGVTYGAGVGTALISANTRNVTITTLDTATTATTVDTTVISGSRNVTITNLTNGAGDILTADGLTGNLTIGSTVATGVIIGGQGNDAITVGAASVVRGGNGSDVITGSGGNDTIFGEAGNDRIAAGDGNDLVDGGAGNDILQGQGGNDTIRGGEGDDLIVGGAGADVLTGGAGNDTFQFAVVNPGAAEVQTLQVTSVVTAAGGTIILNVPTIATAVTTTFNSGSAAVTAGAVATAIAAAINSADGSANLVVATVATAASTTVTLTFATSVGDVALVTRSTAGTASGGATTITEVTRGVTAVAAADSNETNMDRITDWGTGSNVISLSNGTITLDGTAVVGTATTAGISTAGLISFATLNAATTPVTIAAALTLAEAALAGGASNAAGQAGVFNFGGDAYIYISDGVNGHGATTDTVIRVVGVTAETGLTVFGGDIVGIA